jgi:fatty acid elongase 3
MYSWLQYLTPRDSILFSRDCPRSLTAVHSDSQFYELFDTVLMVLKKRRLNFLHVYHHCIVIPLFYVYMKTNMVSQWILVVANSTVHVLMYYYYAMATVGRTVWWKKYITQAQIVQFVIDLTATWPYPILYHSTAGCSGSIRGWLFGQAVGLSFYKLFRDFYLRSYKAAPIKGAMSPKKAD